MGGATDEGEGAGDTETRTVDTETIRKVLFPQMDTDDGGDVSEAEFIAWHGVHRLEETSTVQATIEYDFEHDVYIGSYNATESGRSSRRFVNWHFCAGRQRAARREGSSGPSSARMALQARPCRDT